MHAHRVLTVIFQIKLGKPVASLIAVTGRWVRNKIKAKTFLDIKQFYNIFTSAAYPREVDSSKTVLQMFYFTCSECRSSS